MQHVCQTARPSRSIGTVRPTAVRNVLLWNGRSITIRSEIAAARDIANGFPYVVQLVADAAWTAAGRPDPGGRIGVHAVAAARDLVRADLDALFRARWSGCTGAERRLLSAMAADDGPAARADIARALDVRSDALSVPRARLIDKGLIEPVARGMVDFTIPGFAEFVREGPS
jgi:hypothetical protein